MLLQKYRRRSVRVGSGRAVYSLSTPQKWNFIIISPPPPHTTNGQSHESALVDTHKQHTIAHRDADTFSLKIIINKSTALVCVCAVAATKTKLKRWEFTSTHFATYRNEANQEFDRDAAPHPQQSNAKIN